MNDTHRAFVLLDRPVRPDTLVLAQVLRARHPDLQVAVVEGGGDPASSRLIRCGHQLVAILPLPAPLPHDPEFWAAQGWRDAKTVAAQHRGHVIVSTVGDSGTRLASARLTTAVAGALIASVPECSAVVWCGKVANPAEVWEEMSRNSLAPYPDYPFMLWIDARPFRSETGLGVVTTGLSDFAGREIEFESERLDVVTLLQKVLDLAAYLIEHGDKVKDGDTFGGSEQERLTVHHRMSERFGGMPVLFCALE